MTPAQGEVWTLPSGLRVMIVSNDTFNETGSMPVCIPLIRARGPENEFLVVTNETDPVSGTLLLPDLGPTSLHGANIVAVIGGSTMAAVSAKLARLFAH